MNIHDEVLRWERLLNTVLWQKLSLARPATALVPVTNHILSQLFVQYQIVMNRLNFYKVDMTRTVIKEDNCAI